MSKAKVATVWLDGCSGCHMSLLDMDETIVAVAQKADLVYGPLVDAQVFPEGVDVTLVEGAVSSQDDLEKIQLVRSRSRLVVALGDCAITGNIPALRNQFKLEDVVARGFVETESTQIGEIPGNSILPRLLKKVRPIQEFVKVDAHIPGCPPDADTIWYVLTELLAGRMPKWTEKNLCYD